jgi:hypothetical protein
MTTSAFSSTNPLKLPARPTSGPNNFRFAQHPFLNECNRLISSTKISPTKTSFVAILGFDGSLPGSDSHPFDGLASASNIHFVRRLRYSQPDI